ncbi:uncharacterized protein LOC128559685 [Mercenaria mercenaria]|uniref:uncharacterized protein LOC128559685 n=1 Tax=Mercenaria mercenaria TaxID=6596 RepID=UPI00234F2003|nr:uncharacterized protein LOC128559685 [Mercenaria mercenaria]
MPKWEKTDNTVLTTKQTAINNSCTYNMPHQNNTIVEFNGIHNIMDVNRFSNYRKLLRFTAYVMRFIDKCRSPRCSANLELLTVHELQHAEIMWIRSCQSVTFHNEIDNMDSKGTRLPLVRQLRLFKDDTGIIRSGGRIHNAPLDMLTKFPYLLPAKHPFTRLLIQDAHESQLHAGISATITHLRQKFWIPAIRQAVHCVIRKCVTCRKVTGKQYTAPEPPLLPKNRVEDTPPFTVTGVDFTGALYVRKYDGSKSKAYVCLFMCASTRAVHLELVHDLSEESFMAAFRRFTSRKSLPRIMISDNATTFNAAARNIRELTQSRTVRETLNNGGTEWRFIPKRAPWFGGWWEQLIGLTKTTIKKVLGRSFVTFQTL